VDASIDCTVDALAPGTEEGRRIAISLGDRDPRISEWGNLDSSPSPEHIG